MSVPREGERWAHFKIKSEIARGNMGVVYLATDTESGQDVALKILVVVHSDPDAGARFKREAKSLARLSHPNIVRIHSYGVHEGTPFLSMEYVPGDTLHGLLERAGLPVARVVDLLAKLGRAIDHAHSRGVIHRDIKPANILIGPDGNPRITDFGLARLADASISLTHDGDLVGTPVFMSPEQIQGTLSAMGPASDVWALGVTFYYMLTGRLPFGGKTVDEVSRQVVQQEPVPPSKIVKQIPEDLERICLAALRKDPKLRYRSAGELVRDLEAYLKGKTVLAGTVNLAVRLRRLARFARLHAAPVAAAAGVVIALTLGIGYTSVVRSRASQRNAQELVKLSLERRSAAWSAVRSAEDALSKLDPWKAAAHCRQAESELAWSSAYLDRAWASQPEHSQETATPSLQEPPKAGEVERGIHRDPVLVALRARAMGVKGCALASGLDPEPGEDAATCLLDAYAQTRDPELLAFMVTLAERGRREAGEQAREHVEARWAATPPDSRHAQQLLELRARLADLEGSEVRAVWAAHLKSGPLIAAAQELEADWQLEAGDVVAALDVLGPPRPGESAPRRLLRQRVARAQGAWKTERLLRRRLVAGDGPDALRAELVGVASLIDRGLPRAALARIARLRSSPLPPAEEARVALLEASAHWLTGHEQPRLLWAQTKNDSLPIALRVEATRLARLHDPGVEPPGVQAELRGRARRTRRMEVVARMRPIVGAALSRLALRKLQLPPTEQTSRADAMSLGVEAIALQRPEPLAHGAILLVDRERNEEARELLDRCAPSARQHASVRLARRLLLDQPFQVDAVQRALPVPPPPRGTWVGLAALAASTQESDRNARMRVRATAGRALDMAVRQDPCHLLPRLLRARLGLFKASDPSTPGDAARRARKAALGDAAAACVIDPGAPEAWGLFLQLVWVNRRRQYPAFAQRHLAAWIDALDPAEQILLPQLSKLRDPDKIAATEFLQRKNPEGEAAVRLLGALATAQQGDRRVTEFANTETQVVAKLEQQLEQTPAGLDRALLRGELLLERPSELDALLLEPAASLGTGLEPELERIVQGQGSRAAAAAAFRIVLALRGLEGKDDEARRAVHQRCLRDLECVARRRPVAGVLALRAAIEVWAGELGAKELADLVVHRWQGELYDALSALAVGEPPPPGKLASLEPLERLRPE